MIETERLILRDWQERDLATWIDMNADPKVMRYFPAMLNADESTAMYERIRTHIGANGWGLWAAEIKTSSDFIGFIGLSNLDLGLDWTPCVEVGWRLKFSAWGCGYATEGARAALDFGTQHFDTIYSVTATTNLRSQAVMQRIGLQRRADLDFAHPRVTRADLIPHVVYATS